MTKTWVIGVDQATDPKKVGLALGCYEADRGRVTDVVLGSTKGSVVEQIAGWVRGKPRVLIAVDAPLGWPTALARELPAHRAGMGLKEAPDRLFARETDRFVHTTVEKKPLDVGADRIARTAVAALALLERLRENVNQEIPLAWTPKIWGSSSRDRGLPNRNAEGLRPARWWIQEA